MGKLLAALLLGGMLSTVLAASVPPTLELRQLASSDPQGLIVKVRADLDAGAYEGSPAREREALWWMGRAGVSVADDAAVTEAAARLRSLGSMNHDKLAESYAGFLSADLRIAHGDGSGVGGAIKAAALQLESHEPARRALATFQLCDVYNMAFQYARSQPLCSKAAAAFAALGDDWNEAQARNNEGANAYGLGEYAAAEQFYQQARALYHAAGDHAQALMVGDNLAQVYLKTGRPREALALSRASLADERVKGRESDALISQYNIARALEATGARREATDLIAKTVAQARKANLNSLVPDLLQEQSRIAERNGDLKLALATERDALAASSAHWTRSLASEQSELAARYAAREKEIRIHDLEHANQVKALKLRAVEAEAARNALRMQRQRGTLWAMLMAAVGLVVGVVSLLVLVRSQRRHANELRRQVLEDPLTGVGNRRSFFMRAQKLLDEHTGQPRVHALLLFDFDNFKQINDRCGHPFGDIVLNVSLQQLCTVVGARGTLARLGGEEFVVMCPDMGGTRAFGVAEELRAAIAGLVFPHAPDDLEVTISTGVALFDGDHCHNVDSWVRAADDAMYAAKARGRDRVVVAQAVDQLLVQAGAESRPVR